jgi:hypothetical protein
MADPHTPHVLFPKQFSQQTYPQLLQSTSFEHEPQPFAKQ